MEARSGIGRMEGGEGGPRLLTDEHPEARRLPGPGAHTGASENMRKALRSGRV